MRGGARARRGGALGAAGIAAAAPGRTSSTSPARSISPISPARGTAAGPGASIPSGCLGTANGAAGAAALGTAWGAGGRGTAAATTTPARSGTSGTSGRPGSCGRGGGAPLGAAPYEGISTAAPGSAIAGGSRDGLRKRPGGEAAPPNFDWVAGAGSSAMANAAGPGASRANRACSFSRLSCSAASILAWVMAPERAIASRIAEPGGGSSSGLFASHSSKCSGKR